jgi:phosphoglycerate kinase
MPIDLQLAGRAVRLPTLDDFDPAGKRVLVRVDFNVPLAGGVVTDDTRLRAALPTLTELLDRGASLVLMSHLGRPKGPDPRFAMAPVGAALAELLGRPVRTLPVIVGPDAEAAAHGLRPGDVLLLENLRFDGGEKADDPAFTAALARLGDVYVNDAFGTAHRAAASVVGVTRLLPSYAGRLMARELEVLGKALGDPAHPFVVVLGGAKIGDKIGVIDALRPRADTILVGGGMANTFLAGAGVPMADSLVETDRLADARRIRSDAGSKLVLPTDLVIGDAFSAAAAVRTVPVAEGVPAGWRALDIGADTVGAFADHLRKARTVLWNGPMGAFELPPFARGTFAVAEVLAGLDRALTVVGGGDSAAAIRAAGLVDAIDWVSTGGGATLEMLEGKTLPAVAALVGEGAGGA